MLFEDLTEDLSSQEAAEAPRAARMPLLEAYWQDLLTSGQEAPPTEPQPPVAAIEKLPLPAADRELAAAL